MNPRSTVATVTEIYDYLRLLFARVGKVHCYQCGDPIQSQTISQMAKEILKLEEGTRIHVTAPIVRGKKGEYEKELARCKRLGFLRAVIDGELVSLDEAPKLDKKKKHSISIVVDRLIMRPDLRQRLVDSLETAVKLTDGLAGIQKLEKVKGKWTPGEEQLFSEHFACVNCNISYGEVEPRLFSFNSPFGACPGCNGLGMKKYFDPHLIVPNEKLSVREL